MAPTILSRTELLSQWRAGIRIAHVGHRFAATHYERLNRTLGIVGIIASAVVGTTLFSTIGSLTNPSLQIVLALLSILTASLAAMQTFFNYSEVAENHKKTAARYGDIRRKYELFLILPEAEQQNKFLQEIRKEWSLLDQDSPTIPPNIYKKAQQAIYKESTNRRVNVER